jgi:DNA repair exonuclease SbcCD nuclease subunit
MFRFLHAADIHLDSPLLGLDRYEGMPVKTLRQAGRKALENLVNLAIRKRVRFVILAGDLFDGDWPDVNTGLFFVAQMARLQEHNIPVFVISGNHDAANRMTRSLPYPKNVHMFPADQPTTFRLSDVAVALHGQSYPQSVVTENVARKYPPADPALLNIGLLHTGLDGREGHARYAPCTPEDLSRSRYQYWALGHVHQRESVSTNPRTLIEFPGNIQGRHARELGPKGCLIVHVDSDRTLKSEFHSLDVCRWERIEVDCEDVTSSEELQDLVKQHLQDALDEAEGRLLVARIVLTGTCPLHHDLHAHRRHYRDDLRAAALDVDNSRLAIEKLEVRTQATQDDAQTLGEDARSILRKEVEILKKDKGLLKELVGDEDWERLLRNLPRELRDYSDRLQDSGSEEFQAVLQRAEAILECGTAEVE